jgi:hypothetical protein
MFSSTSCSRTPSNYVFALRVGDQVSDSIWRFTHSKIAYYTTCTIVEGPSLHFRYVCQYINVYMGCRPDGRREFADFTQIWIKSTPFGYRIRGDHRYMRIDIFALDLVLFLWGNTARNLEELSAKAESAAKVILIRRRLHSADSFNSVPCPSGDPASRL